MQVLDWLYVQDGNASLHLDHDALRVRRPQGEPMTLPLQALDGIVCFGPISISPALIERCAKDGRALVLLQRNGQFAARAEGPLRGNVLLRQAQHLAAADGALAREVARPMVAGKVQASRQVLMRGARERSGPAAERLALAASGMAQLLPRIHAASDLDQLRGFEGEAASIYFGAFGALLLEPGWRFDRRQRRPPRDPLNALLSFLYTLIRTEVVAALEATGLDPQVGYLHTLRPGRPALALDLMEELRAPLADRLALTLVNRRQVSLYHFEEQPGGAVAMTAEGRKIVLFAYRNRMAEAVRHPVLKQRLSWRLIPHAQARLLARHLRGDLASYLPFLSK